MAASARAGAGGAGAQDPLEEMLAAAVAAALWQAVRADRIECEVLAEIEPRAGHHHGSDLQERDHAVPATTTAATCRSVTMPRR